VAAGGWAMLYGRTEVRVTTMPGPTRGFTGRRRPPVGHRLPPGQYDVGGEWPVLTAEATPRSTPENASVRIDGLVRQERSWTYDDLQQLPPSAYAGDIHCVTTWSKFGTTFGGVSLDTLLELVAPRATATHVLVESVSGYTTNLPLEHVRGGRAWIVWTYDGSPLPPEHGGPLRLLVPHLYFWKSAKWVERITLLDREIQGFWERNGYHDLGDPWLEQRYQGD
jgi:DMSO/TMAO reductase YedYZ molybdopterin-dependent catalytic subunit